MRRFRKSKTITPGMEVVLRDPRHRKAGGRTPYRQPYTDPCVVLDIHGNKCKVKKPDGTILENIHLEDVLVVPERARSLEKEPFEFTDDADELNLDAVDKRRSPGMMLEDQGQKVKEHDEHFKMKPGKLEKIMTGNHIVYLVAESKRSAQLAKCCQCLGPKQP